MLLQMEATGHGQAFPLKTICHFLHATFKLLGAVFHGAAPKKDTKQLLHLTLLDKVISDDLPAATFSLILSTI